MTPHRSPVGGHVPKPTRRAGHPRACRTCGNWDTVQAVDNHGQPYTGCAHCVILANPPAHDWNEPILDWRATRTCKRCGIVHEYDHGPNGGPERYLPFGGGRAAHEDPGCKPRKEPA